MSIPVSSVDHESRLARLIFPLPPRTPGWVLAEPGLSLSLCGPGASPEDRIAAATAFVCAVRGLLHDPATAGALWPDQAAQVGRRAAAEAIAATRREVTS